MACHAIFDRFCSGCRKAAVFGFDDGTAHDRRIVDILNRHGLRGTFFLNSGRLGHSGHLAADELPALFAGHEVGSHTVNHSCLTHLTREGIAREVMEDRRALEACVGQPVRGLAYPGGDFDGRVARMLPSLGISYARTCRQAEGFSPPTDMLQWPISGHAANAAELVDAFLSIPPTWGRQVLYIMGHSADIERTGGWESFDRACARLGRNPSVWSATNGELAEYLLALNAVESSVDGSIIRNPTAQPLWFSHPDLLAPPSMVQPGETRRLW